MAKPTTAEEAILKRALGPQNVTVGTEEVEQYDIDQLIAADEYLTRKASRETAAARPGFGLGFTKLIPPGGG